MDENMQITKWSVRFFGGQLMILGSLIVSMTFGIGCHQQQPNIVVIYVDDLGYGDLGCYGSEIPTPHIDGLAAEGMRFTNFYVAGSVCTPSRYGLLTGNYAFRSKNGLETVIMPGDKKSLMPSEITLPEYLQEAGYQTALLGKWHLGHHNKEAFPVHHGFDLFIGHAGGCIDYYEHNYGALYEDWYYNTSRIQEKGYSTDLITNHSLNYLDTVGHDQPFFLMLSYNAPHYGKTTSTREEAHTLVLNAYEHKGVALKNTLQVPPEYLEQVEFIKDPYRRYYAGMIVNLDANISRFIHQLKASGHYDNTMIWLISDNGGYALSHHGHASNGPLKGEKGSFYEGGIKVPAICVWPGQINEASVNDHVVANIDLLPTFSGMAGYDLHQAVDGQNIKDLVNGKPGGDRQLLWKYHSRFALRSGKWKMVNGTELYNLETDPYEQTNVAAENKMKLDEMIESWKAIKDNN